MVVKNSNRPHDKVSAWLADKINDGTLCKGMAVPSERALADELGIARVTVRAALAELEMAGTLVRHGCNGRKRFVSDSAFENHAVSKDAACRHSLAAATILLLVEFGLLPDGKRAPSWSEAALTQELCSIAAVKGFHVMVVNCAVLTRSDITKLLDSNPSGGLVLGTVSSNPIARAFADACRKRGVPLVVYGNAPDLADFDRVYSDHAAGEADIVRWLASRGCRRIIPFWEKETSRFWQSRRLAGYKSAMGKVGLDAREPVYYADMLPARVSKEKEFEVLKALAVATLVGEIRDNGVPDALLAVNDHYARVISAALRELGIEPNREVLVAGYDNVPNMDRDDAIVTIDKHNERTASMMMELLLERISGELPKEPQAKVSPHECIVRDAKVVPSRHRQTHLSFKKKGRK